MKAHYQKRQPVYPGQLVFQNITPQQKAILLYFLSPAHSRDRLPDHQHKRRSSQSFNGRTAVGRQLDEHCRAQEAFSGAIKIDIKFPFS